MDYSKQQIINTTPNHQGSWTRVNRNNNNEKSIIDYIITCQHLASKTIESTTEDGTTNIIRGNNPTDHNIITAILDIETKKKKPKQPNNGRKANQRTGKSLITQSRKNGRQ